MRKAFCKNVENVGKMSSLLAVNEEKVLINTHVFTEMKNELIETCVAPGIKMHVKTTGFFIVFLSVLLETQRTFRETAALW